MNFTLAQRFIEEGKNIRRINWRREYSIFKMFKSFPLDKNNYGLQTRKGVLLWQPTEEDFSAYDWVVVEKE